MPIVNSQSAFVFSCLIVFFNDVESCSFSNNCNNKLLDGDFHTKAQNK